MTIPATTTDPAAIPVTPTDSSATTTAPEAEHFAVAFRLDDLKEGEFRGVASVFGNQINTFMPTFIERGAFAKSIRQAGRRGFPVLWQHDVKAPVGRTLAVQETERGLEIRGRLSDTQLGRDARTLLRDKVLDGLSIGFTPVKWRMEETKDGLRRHLEEVQLFEISLVTFPADSQARVTEAAAGPPAPELEFDPEALLSQITALRALPEDERAAVLGESRIAEALAALRLAPPASEPPLPPALDLTARLRDLDVAEAVLRLSA